MPQVKVGWRSGSVAAPSVSAILLDAYSGAAAAYSLRKLSSTYTGSAIRVRRSSDNTELNIGFDANGDLDTYALSAFVGSVNGFVTTWYDQSGSGNNATQTTASSQPRIVNAGIIETVGGKPAVRWLVIGGLEMVLSMNTSLSNVRSVFLNITYLSGIARVPLLGHTTAYDYHSDADVYLSSQYAANYVKNGSNYINGVSKTLATFAKSSSNSLITMIHTSASGNVNQISSDRNIGRWDWSVFTGYFSEIILYSSDQTTNRINIESNINTYYSIYPNPTSVWNLLAAAYNADSAGSSSLKTSLVAAYNGESNTNDSFGTNNGTAQGGLTYGTGKIGNAFQSNGTNSYISLPDNSLNLTGDFSISTWVYFTGLGTWQEVISNYFNTSMTQSGWDISVSPVGVLNFSTYRSNTIYQALTYNISSYLNQWVHLVVTRKPTVSNGHKIYINGTLVAQQTGMDPVYNSTQWCNINSLKYNGGVSYHLLSGSKIDALNVWQKELTQSEITELYNSGNGAQYIGDNFYKPTPNDALNTYNGTAQGGLTYGVGKVGTAFVGNGTNAYITLANNSFKFTNSQSFSISTWVNITNSNVSNIIFSSWLYSGAQGCGWMLRTTSFSSTNCNLDFVTDWQGGTGTPFALSVSNAFAINTWVFVTATRNGSTGVEKLYVNGSQMATRTLIPTYLYTSNTVYPSILAQKYDSSSVSGYLNGKIDAVGIWNKELTSAEVTELYNSGNGKQYPN